MDAEGVLHFGTMILLAEDSGLKQRRCMLVRIRERCKGMFCLIVC